MERCSSGSCASGSRRRTEQELSDLGRLEFEWVLFRLLRLSRRKCRPPMTHGTAPQTRRQKFGVWGYRQGIKNAKNRNFLREFTCHLADLKGLPGHQYPFVRSQDLGDKPAEAFLAKRRSLCVYPSSAL
jgi:hypothetical protein